MEMSAEDLNALGRRLAAAEPSEADLDVFRAFRRTFREALNAVEAELWNIAPGVHALQVGARRKNVTSVIPKLRRKPDALLSEMQDIAGARIVVPSLVEVEEVRAQVPAEQVQWVSDYREKPVKYGYRALHLVLRPLPAKLVELQIRTQVQNEWANTSEFLAHRFGLPVKSGRGPKFVHEALEELSRVGRAVDLARADRVRRTAGLADLLREAEVNVTAPEAHLNDQAIFLRRRLDHLTALANDVYDQLEGFRKQALSLEDLEEGG